jgi:predicted P-loop ATPase
MPRIPRDKKEAEEFVHHAMQEWRLALLLNESGAPKTCLANALIALRGHAEWRGILWFDTLHQRTMLRGKLPWCDRHEERAWLPQDDGLAADWLQHEGIMLASKAASEAIELVGHDQPYHPVLDYLSRVKWDGEPRTDKWAIQCLGVTDTDYARAVSSRWLISAVARVMEPGCKADCALILEGEQGIGKSQALKILFNPWFTDELAELGSKDAAIQLAGAWCVELAELVGMRRADIDRVKAFISRTHDRYRPVYGIRTIEQPRQCVFAGTVNDREYLRDETGGRRFWPISCKAIDLDKLAEWRDQLWAEARDQYEAGELWWIDGELAASAEEMQEERRYQDPWEEQVAEYLRGKADTSVNEILAELDIARGERSLAQAMRVGSALRLLGWERYQKRDDRARSWRYRRVLPLG